MKPNGELHCLYAEDFDPTTGDILCINSHSNDERPRIPANNSGILFYKLTASAQKMGGNSDAKVTCSESPSFGISSNGSLASGSQDSTEKMWDLGSNVFVKVNDYKGNILIHIREYYFGKNEERKPLKHGIAINPSQYQVLKSHLAIIENNLGMHGNLGNTLLNLGLQKAVEVKKCKDPQKNSIGFKKKGKIAISLQPQQFETLKSILAEVDGELKIHEERN